MMHFNIPIKMYLINVYMCPLVHIAWKSQLLCLEQSFCKAFNMTDNVWYFKLWTKANMDLMNTSIY